MVFGLTFKSLIHFVFIFAYGVKYKFHSFAGSCPILPTPFIEEAVFSPLHILSFFVID